MKGDERRKHLRIRTTLDVEYRADPPTRRAHVEDISEAGAFIGTDNPLPTETLIDFRLDLPNPEPPIEGRAKVVWSQPSMGMGIEFLGLGPESRDRIRYYLGPHPSSASG